MEMIPSKKVNIVMDASQYDMFRLCEARYDYRYNMNKSLPGKSKPLDRGTIVHVGCESYYDSLKSGAKYDYAVGAALMKIREASVIDSDLDSAEIDRILDVMEEYFDYWRTADQNMRIIEVEKPFMYLLYEDDEIRFYMTGKIDLIYGDDKYEKMPVDHKSYDRSYDVSRLSNQFRNYCMATECDILTVNKIGFQKTLKPHEKYIRTPVSYDKLALNEWRDNVIKVIFHYLRCVAEKSWPMNETSCLKFNRLCEYHEVCDSSGKEAKLFKLASNYIDIEPWDVTKVLRKSSDVIKEAEVKETQEK